VTLFDTHCTFRRPCVEWDVKLYYTIPTMYGKGNGRHADAREKPTALTII